MAEKECKCPVCRNWKRRARPLEPETGLDRMLLEYTVLARICDELKGVNGMSRVVSDAKGLVEDRIRIIKGLGSANLESMTQYVAEISRLVKADPVKAYEVLIEKLGDPDLRRLDRLASENCYPVELSGTTKPDLVERLYGERARHDELQGIMSSINSALGGKNG